MNWHRYQPETHEYEHPVVCQPNPARAGEHLIPPSATPIAPPTIPDKKAAVFQGDQWILVEDHRGTTIYSRKDGTAKRVKELGPIPDGYSTEPFHPSKFASFYLSNGFARQERIKHRQKKKAQAHQQAINQYVEAFM